MRDNNAADAPPLRGCSATALGTLAAPHAASGPCTRGVAGTGEPFVYAGYAGVAGGGVVPPLEFTNASSASAMGSILFSDAGGGMPVLLGGAAYVV